MKPINMKTWEVQAIWENRKTVTRRVVKPQPRNTVEKIAMERYHKPYRPGSVMYVRETWLAMPTFYTDGRPPVEYLYKTDMTHPEEYSWRPSVHMPREAARIFLRVTDVRVSRLQWCGNMEAKEEGCTCCSQFVRFWDSTIKPKDRALYGWDANPWVWVIEFEKISKKEAIK